MQDSYLSHLVTQSEVVQGEQTSELPAFPQISHIIREIRQFQQTAYKIEHQAKVSAWYPWPGLAQFLPCWHALSSHRPRCICPRSERSCPSFLVSL